MKISLSRHIQSVLLLSFVLISISMQAQDNKNSEDSLRTLEILKDALKEAIQENSDSDSDSGTLDMEVDGLIMDETITKVGRDFYDLFYSSWSTPMNAKIFQL